MHTTVSIFSVVTLRHGILERPFIMAVSRVMGMPRMLRGVIASTLSHITILTWDMILSRGGVLVGWVG